MDLLISPTEIWQIAVIKLLFYLFIGLGILFWSKFRKPILFIVLISLFLGFTYLTLIYQSETTWWGLEGDEIFITAFFQKVASGQFFSDFFYSDLPPFYPPLFFWLVGGLVFLFKFNGIQAAQLGVTLVLFLTPFLVYFWQKQYLKAKKGKIEEWKLVLAPALIFIVADWAAVITKPYEFISAVLVVFWAAFLLCDLHYKLLNPKKIIFYGISGGLLFLTFYFWFFPVILALALFKLFTEIKFKDYFGRLIIIGVLVLSVSLPYLLPLVISYLAYGSENWQPAFFVQQDLNLYLPFFQFSIFGLVSLIGLLAIIFYWAKPYIKALGVLLISAYLWQLINIITIIFYQAPFKGEKAFLFLGGAILSIAAAYGIGEFISDKLKNKKLFTGLFIFGWIILASQLLGGSFIDDPTVRDQLLIMKQPPREEFINVIDELKKVPNIENLTILSSGVPQLSAYLPLDYYVSYNQHFSHPAANFSQRYHFINDLAFSIDAKDFHQKLKQAPFKTIDALLFFKGPDFYPVHFWVDYYPLGGGEVETRIPIDLIDERYFVKVFEDDYFVFYQVK